MFSGHIKDYATYCVVKSERNTLEMVIEMAERLLNDTDEEFESDKFASDKP